VRRDAEALPTCGRVLYDGRAMRAVASTLFVLAAIVVVLYVALRGPDHAPVRYVPSVSPMAVVSGRAVDGSGHPVADVPLTWFSLVETQGGLVGGTMFRGDETAVRTATDGTFRIEGLRGQEGYVAVGSDDPLREGASGRVRLRAGFEATELALTVVEVPRERRLQGTAVRIDGSPAAGVHIEARGRSWRGNWQQLHFTDSTGAFEFAAPWKGGECELWLMGTGAPKRLPGTYRLGMRGIVVQLP